MWPPVLLTSSAHLALSLSCTASVLEHYLVAAKNQVLIEQLWSAGGSAGLQLSLGPHLLWWFWQLASCPQCCLRVSLFYSSRSLCPDSFLVYILLSSHAIVFFRS